MTDRVYHRWADGTFRRKYQRPPRKGTWARTIHDTIESYLEHELREIFDRAEHARLLRERLNHPLFR